MTLGGKFVSTFPIFYLLLVLSWVYKMFSHFEWFDFIVLVSIVYLLPLILHRIHFFFFPFPFSFFYLLSIILGGQPTCFNILL